MQVDCHPFSSQIELLDQLANHLQQGGKLTNFTPVSNVEIDTTMDNEIDTTIDNQIEPVHSPIDTQLLGEIVTAIASRLQPPDPEGKYSQTSLPYQLYISCDNLLVEGATSGACKLVSSLKKPVFPARGKGWQV